MAVMCGGEKWRQDFQLVARMAKDGDLQQESTIYNIDTYFI